MRPIALLLIGATALAGMGAAAAGEKPQGKEVFAQYCSQCHGPGDAPGTVQLGRTRGKDKALLAERSDLAPEYIEYIVRHGLKSMPPFAPSDLDDARLKALVEYLTRPVLNNR
jgi:mono/diheme cytochrome c family protein